MNHLFDISADVDDAAIIVAANALLAVVARS
jgi:hypothetical protein